MKRRLLLTLLLLLGIVPEFLWSPLLNVLLNFFNPNYIFRANTLGQLSVHTVSFLLILETIGFIGAAAVLAKQVPVLRGRKKVFAAGSLVAACVLGSLALFATWISLSLRNVGF